MRKQRNYFTEDQINNFVKEKKEILGVLKWLKAIEESIQIAEKETEGLKENEKWIKLKKFLKGKEEKYTLELFKIEKILLADMIKGFKTKESKPFEEQELKL